MEGTGIERMVVELADQVRNRYYGKYRGVVRDNADPKNMGRIRADVPAVLDDKTSSWALPCTPYAGPDEGYYAIPAVGSAVWIEWEAGDPSRPIWSGCWWGQGRAPKNEAGAGHTPSLKVIRSEKGLLISMDDNGQTISVSDENGSNILKIEVQAGNVLLKGASKVTVEAPQINLVENATHPVVFGDQLLQYLGQLVGMLQGHMHPGQMALGVFPVTPMVPTPTFPIPQTTMLSNIAKSG